MQQPEEEGTFNEQDIQKQLSVRRIIIPILIGLLAASWLLYNNLSKVHFEKTDAGKGAYTWIDSNANGKIEFTNEKEFEQTLNGDFNRLTYTDNLSAIHWSWMATFWMFIGLLMMLTRDVAYMYRLRTLTDKQLSWRQAFDVIMIWEFASAITPSVVGGSGIAMFIVNREGINMGKSTAVVLITALFDEIFYVSMVLLILIGIGTENLFPVQLQREYFGITLGTQDIFWVGYIFLVVLTILIVLAVFTLPHVFRSLLIKVFNIPVLRRWKAGAIKTGDEIVITSEELKGKPASYWIKAGLATFFSWTARYWVVNFLLLAFLPIGDGFTLGEHIMIYARQLVMWVIMLISPTPGGAGLAEFAFSEFLNEFTPLGLAGALAILWRLMSYYPYLFIGAIILPRWLKRTAKKNGK